MDDEELDEELLESPAAVEDEAPPIPDWVTRVDAFDEYLKRGVELNVRVRTRCAIPACHGQLRPYKSPPIGPGLWKCDRCGDEQIVAF
jgi:hypothetical protein